MNAEVGGLTDAEREALDVCPDCGCGAHQHNDLGRTVNEVVCALTVREARAARVERIKRDAYQQGRADLAATVEELPRYGYNSHLLLLSDALAVLAADTVPRGG